MAGCQGPFARKDPIHRGAQRVNPKILGRAGRLPYLTAGQ